METRRELNRMAVLETLPNRLSPIIMREGIRRLRNQQVSPKSPDDVRRLPQEPVLLGFLKGRFWKEASDPAKGVAVRALGLIADVPFLKEKTMKRILNVFASAALGALLLTSLLGSGQGTANDAEKEKRGNIKRVGMVVGIRSDKIEEYKKLHADSNRGVRDLLRKYHMRNFSIFLQQIDGKWYEFGYYEYDGADFEGDTARLAAEPRNIEWLKLCDPMQLPLPGARGWTEMERIYFND